MAEHHALREPRGAAGVKDPSEVVTSAAGVLDGCRVERLEIRHHACERRCVAAMDDVGQDRGGSAQLFN